MAFRNFQTHQLNSLKPSPVSEMSAYPPANLRMLFPTHIWVREFWPQIYSLWHALDWGLLSKILAHFPTCSLGIQQPHKHSHSLQLATHTELTHHYGQYAWCWFFLSPRGFLQRTLWSHQSTDMALERATSHIKVTHLPCLFQLMPWENVDRSTF